MPAQDNSITAPHASQRFSDSPPPGTFELALWLAGYFLIAWFLINGRLAKIAHEMWKDTILLPGITSDLPTLQKICRWSGIAMFLFASIVCALAIFRQ
jgi:hypothetical protein